MNQPYLKIKLLFPQSILPTKHTEDAFFDLYGIFPEETLLLFPGEIKLISLGFATEFPPNWVFRIMERSSTGSKWLAVRCWIIDSGYRGEYFIALNNTANHLIIISNKTTTEIQKNFKGKLTEWANNFILYPQSKAIAQGWLIYAPHIKIEQVTELDNSSIRGDGTLWSTHK